MRVKVLTGARNEQMILSKLPKSKNFSSRASSSSSSDPQSSLPLTTFFKTGRRPALKHHNKFLFKLFRAKKFQFITHFISQLDSNQINGDRLTHSIFTRALLKQHKYEQTVEFINTHLEKTPQILQNRVLDSLIQGFCVDLKDPESGFSLLRDYSKVGGVLPSSLTFRALISGFCEQGKTNRAIEVLEMMNDEKFEYPFVNFVFTSVVSGFVNAGKSGLAVEFYENAANSRALQMNLVAYTCVLIAYCRVGKLAEAFDLVGRIEKDHRLALDVAFFGSLVYECFRAGIAGEALRRHKEMVEREIALDTVTYTILIDGFSKLGFVEKAVGFLYRMRKDGIEPNLITYTTIVSGFCKKGKLEEAFATFKTLEDSGIEPDEFPYAALIDGLCRIRDFDAVSHVLDAMNEKGVRPSDVTLNTIINGLCRAGRTAEACEVSRGFLGDVVTYSTLLHGYTEEGDSMGILTTKKRLKESGVRMDVVMCNVLIRALFTVGSFEDVSAVYKGMPEMGLAPNHVTYCTLIDGYCRFDRIDEALEIFDEFRRRSSIFSPACYNRIINGLCKKGMAAMAVRVFLELNERGLPLDAGVSRVLLESIARATGPEGVLDFISKTEKLGREMFDAFDVVNYTMVVDGLCKAGHVRKALDVCVLAKKKGVTLNVVTYNVVINGLCRQGCLVEAFRLFDSLETVGITPSGITYATLIDTLSKHGHLLDARTLFDRMVSEGLNPNTRVHNSLVHGYCKFGRLTEALELVRSLDGKGLKADGFTVSAVIKGFCREGDMEGALEYYSESRRNGMPPDLLGFTWLVRGLCSKGRMEEARGVLRETLRAESVVGLLNGVDVGDGGAGSVERFLVSLCERGDIRGAVAVLDEVASAFFPVGKHCREGNLETGAGKEERLDGIVYDDEEKSTDFESCYGLLAALCSRGDLRKANEVAKQIAGFHGG